MEALTADSSISMRAKGLGTGAGARIGEEEEDGGAGAGGRSAVLVHPDEAIKRIKAYIEVNSSAPTRSGMAGPTRATGINRRAADLEQAIKRIKAYIEVNSSAPTRSGMAGPTRASSINCRAADLEQEFWSRMAHVISDKGTRVWKALEKQLEDYMAQLQSRAASLEEVESLHHQNGELRALLNQYLSSRINDELQIPPTQII
eukprot:gene27431-4731_t